MGNHGRGGGGYPQNTGVVVDLVYTIDLESMMITDGNDREI